MVDPDIERTRKGVHLTARSLSVLLAALVLSSPLMPQPLTLSVDADSLPSWNKVFHLHDGEVLSTSYYDWLNSSDPYNPPYTDYDSDGLMGITIKKWNPSERWRQFFVLDPEVNRDVHLYGDLSAVIHARSRDNQSGVMRMVFSDAALGDIADPGSWATIGFVDVSLTGPVYSEFKSYNGTMSGVDYTLAADHTLVLTLQRGDSVNDGLIVMYDQDIYDSYVVVGTEDFVSVDEVHTGSYQSPDSYFSDGDVVTVFANVSDPFGSYDIVGATVEVAYSGNMTVVVPTTDMAVYGTDGSALPSWIVFDYDLPLLGNGTYTATVMAYDPQGSPTWLTSEFYVVAVDHFQVDAPSSIVAGQPFSMTVTALDGSDEVLTGWAGIVSLSGFKDDMVSPADGSLAVDSLASEDWTDGQAVIPSQTYDFAEEIIAIRAASMFAYGWSDLIDVRAGPVETITVSPSGPLTLTAGAVQSFTAVGTDALGLVNTSWTPEWSVDGGIGAVEPDGFSSVLTVTGMGTGTLTCSDPQTGASSVVDITVDAGVLASITMDPAGPLTIREGVSQVFTATGLDSLGNEVPIPGAIWTTDTSGYIVGAGPAATYTAGYIPEEGTVEVAVGSVRATADIEVVNALNGPWLNTIPTQIAAEDTNWDLSLAVYWHHTNGTSILRWYVEGVDSSLYIITHDPDSQAIMHFITQPDAFGSDTFRLWVRDPDGFSTYQDISVSIQAVNDRPEFVNSPPTELYVKFDLLYTFDFTYYVDDVDTDQEDLELGSDFPDNLLFDSLIASFLFPEVTPDTNYFEIVEVTVTDAESVSLADETNSDDISIVVYVTDDTPPDMVARLPDVELDEGETIEAFDLDDYFYDIDGDYLVYTYGFHDITIAINETTHVVTIAALSEWSGSTEGTLTARDTTGAIKTDTIIVTVNAVNDAPTVAGMDEAFHIHYDTEAYIDASLYVDDPDDSIDVLSFAFDDTHVTYAGGLIGLLFPANLSGGEFTDPYIVDVQMTVTDPWDSSNDPPAYFQVIVSDDYAPVVVDPAPYYDLISFSEDTYLNGSLDLSLLFYDQDDGELQFRADGCSNICATIYDSGIVNLTAAANWSGSEDIVFKATDPHGAWAAWRATVVVIPVNDAPTASQIPDSIVRGGPRNGQVSIIGYFEDAETLADMLTIVAAPSANVAVVGDNLFFNLPDGVDVMTVTVYAQDEEGLDSNVVTFRVGVSKTMAELIGYPYSLPLVLLAAAVAGYFVARMIPRPYTLENLFLIHNDGRLIAHVTKEENTIIDKDVVSAMFTAVQEFVKDSFQQGEVGLKKLEIGDKNVVIEKGQSAYIAMIYSGWPSKDVMEGLTMLLRDVEERFKGRIEKWNGTMKSLKGVEQMLQAYMTTAYKPGSWTVEEGEGMAEEEWVDILEKQG